MEQYEQIVSVLALTMGASWASGINLYAALLMLGLSSATGNVDLPPDLQILANPLIIGAAGLMYAVEFFADKIPGVDTTWDGIHTFIRIPAGALLAAGAVGDVGTPLALGAAILGGGLATASHAAKAGTRVMINTSPEPFTNWTASITEDVAVFGGMWAALHHPWTFLVMLLVFIILVAWALPKIWRGVKRVFAFIGRCLGIKQDKPEQDALESPQQNPDILDQLERLSRLREQGVLTEAEYQSQKKRILQP